MVNPPVAGHRAGRRAGGERFPLFPLCAERTLAIRAEIARGERERERGREGEEREGGGASKRGLDSEFVRKEGETI